MKIAIKSNHIFPDPYSSPISAYILISDEFIEEILPFSEFNSELSSLYTILDYSDYYIIPGLIDINVHLNSNYDADWPDVENLTKQALIGGVTTLIDNPIMNHKESKEIEEISNINERKLLLQDKIFTDCGLLAYISSHNYLEFSKIFKETGVLGFKLYLSQPFEMNLPAFDPKDLAVFAELLQSNEIKNLCEEIVISINCEMASNRDLFMASPCRNCSKSSRLDLEYDIHNFSGFGGGHHGVYLEEDEEDEQNRRKFHSLNTKKPSEKEDSIIEFLSDIQNKEAFKMDNSSPSTALLGLNSRLISNILELKHVSDLELLDYQDSSVALRNGYSNSSLNFDFQDHDSNLEVDDSLNEEELLANLKKEEDLKGEDHSENFNSPYILEIARDFTLNTNPEAIVKRFDSCPSIPCKTLAFNIKNVLQDAFKEINKEDAVVFTSENSNNSWNSGHKNRPSSNSSFGQRRSSFKNNKNLMTTLSKFKGITLIKTQKTVHHEKENIKNRNYMYFLPNHPVSWETNGVNLVLKFFKEAQNPKQKLILTNLSSPCLAFQLREAKKILPKLQIFADTAAPFVFFNKEMIGDSQTKFKSSPPIRDKETQFFLLRSVKALIFDSVSSYHLSMPQAYKEVDKGNFRRALNGISCIGGSLAMLWTRFYSLLRIKYKKIDVKDQENQKEDLEKLIKKVVFLMSWNPSKLMFLEKKGSLAKGKLADLVVWDPFKIKKIRKFNDLVIKEKKDYSLNGVKVYGEVVLTMLRGDLAFRRGKEGELSFTKKRGRILNNKSWMKI